MVSHQLFMSSKETQLVADYYYIITSSGVTREKSLNF